MAKKLFSDMERLRGKCLVDASGCWLWTGKLDKDGYAGPMTVGSRTDKSRRVVVPHRWMYEQMIGPIGDGLVIDHLCRMRHCVNPSHMEPVTTQENTKRGERANATLCKSGHTLGGDNIYISIHRGQIRRACRMCRNRWVREHGKRTGWAAQKAYRERKKSGSATN